MTTVHTVKSEVKILQNFVPFSEYMNFKNSQTTIALPFLTHNISAIVGVLDVKIGQKTLVDLTENVCVLQAILSYFYHIDCVIHELCTTMRPMLVFV